MPEDAIRALLLEEEEGQGQGLSEERAGVGQIQMMLGTTGHERRTPIELCFPILLKEHKAGTGNGDDCSQKQASEYARKSDHVSEGPERNSRRENCNYKNRG